MIKIHQKISLGLLLLLIPFLTACTLPESIKSAFSNKKPEAAKDANVSQNSKTNEKSPFSQKESSESLSGLEDILKQSKNSQKTMKCEISYTDPVRKEQFEGLAYTDGKRLRMSTKTRSEEGEMEYNTIYDGEYYYTWVNDQKQGTKVEVAKMVGQKTQTQTQGTETQNELMALPNIKYDCKEESLEPSLFEPPSNIEFSSISIPDISKEDLCSSCNGSLDKTERDACLAQLKCK